MTSVVFSTPGLIPIEAFTTFGMSAKPESTNPFGKFGTGLKIAVAVCLRYRQEVIVWRGKDKYTFFTQDKDFRGKQFQKVRMKREWKNLDKLYKKPFSRSYHDLPFTTELGKHWELWQAFREFQTNTMDENGWTCTVDRPGENDDTDITRIQVTGSKFVDEYHDRNRNFLEDGLTVREGSDRIQVIDKPSSHIYFRGVRVHDLKEEAMYTYNFLMDVELTEDRTAKYPFILESYIAEYFMTTESPDKIRIAVSSPKEGSFERSLPYRYTSVLPSKAFTEAAQKSPNVGARELVKVKETTSSSTILTIRIPKPYITDEESYLLEEYLRNAFGDITMESAT